MSETITARSDKLSIAVLQKIFGPEWIEDHIKAQKGFLVCDNTSPEIRETRRMRRIVLAEMLCNFQDMEGVHACFVDLYGGQIESTYAALEIARVIHTQSLDRRIVLKFVKPSNVKKQDYDLFLRFSDGVKVRVESKCNIEKTKITLRTIEKTFSRAKGQLPENVPSIIFLKVPRPWIEDEKFAEEMRRLANRFLARSPWVVSVKYYAVRVVQERDKFGETIGEIVSVQERFNANHGFVQLANRNWQMFPSIPGPLPPPQTNYSGMPKTWQNLIVRDTNL